MEETSRLLRANIVERLRNLAKKESGMPYRYADLMEAAYEIERQAARIAALEAERDDWFDGCRKDYLDERNARMDANVREYAAMERANMAEAKLSKAVKALNRYAHGYCGEDTANATLKEVGDA